MERGRFSAGTAQAGDPPVSLLLVIQDLHVSRELKLRLNSSPRVHPQCFPAGASQGQRRAGKYGDVIDSQSS